MDAFLARFNSGKIIGLIIPLAGMLTGILIAVPAIVAEAWQKTRQAEIEATLKRDMLDRGMSAEDIERVISASAKKNRRHAAWAPKC